MAFTINYAGGTITVADGTLDTTSTSVALPGQNYPGYGGPVDQNLVSLLENFAYYSSSPPNPITGQLWYDTVNSQLKVYDGSTFNRVSGAEVSVSAPLSPEAGDLWFDTVGGTLNVYSGSGWVSSSPPVGLQSAAAVAITGGTITGVNISGLGAPLAIADGGTGATTAPAARTALGLGTMAVVNSPVPVANGGTGSTALTLNNVLLGNGTGAVQVVAPGTSGNVLTSNGTTWASTAVSASSISPAFTGSNQSLAASGYQKLPGGAIIQWGSVNIGIGATATVTFPVAFPTLCTSVTFSQPNQPGTGGWIIMAGAPTTTQVQLTNGSATFSTTPDVYWFACGY